MTRFRKSWRSITGPGSERRSLSRNPTATVFLNAAASSSNFITQHATRNTQSVSPIPLAQELAQVSFGEFEPLVLLTLSKPGDFTPRIRAGRRRKKGANHPAIRHFSQGFLKRDQALESSVSFLIP